MGDEDARRYPGAALVADALHRYGVRMIFGNPGTTELLLLRELMERGERLEFELCLHEDIAMAMAIGYAEVDRGPVGVLVHTLAGFMHGLTNLQAAKALRLPIVVVVGQQDARFLASDPPLSGDVVHMAGAHSTWAWQAERAEDLPKVMHRAFATALAPPQGPVVVSIPVNVLREPTGTVMEPLTRIESATATASVEGECEEVARRVMRRPRRLVVVGDAVAQAGAVESVRAVAEALDATVVTDRMASRANFPTSHHLFDGLIGRSGKEMELRLRDVDVVLAVGSDSLVPLIHDGGLVEWCGDLVVISDDVREVSKGPPAAVVVVGELVSTLRALQRRLEAAGAADRTSKRTEREAGGRPDHDVFDSAAVATCLDVCLPEDTFLVEEAVAGKYALQQRYRLDPPRRLLGSKTGGLGLGLGAAVGASLAARRQTPVVGVVGDGSFLYYPQAIWSAVHAGVDLTVVVLNNNGYGVLYENLELFGIPSTGMGRYLDVKEPLVGFVGLARAFGAQAETVTTSSELEDAVERSLSRGGVGVVEAQIGGSRRHA